MLFLRRHRRHQHAGVLQQLRQPRDALWSALPPETPRIAGAYLARCRSMCCLACWPASTRRSIYSSTATSRACAPSARACSVTPRSRCARAAACRSARPVCQLPPEARTISACSVRRRPTLRTARSSAVGQCCANRPSLDQGGASHPGRAGAERDRISGLVSGGIRAAGLSRSPGERRQRDPGQVSACIGRKPAGPVSARLRSCRRQQPQSFAHGRGFARRQVTRGDELTTLFHDSFSVEPLCRALATSGRHA